MLNYSVTARKLKEKVGGIKRVRKPEPTNWLVKFYVVNEESVLFWLLYIIEHPFKLGRTQKYIEKNRKIMEKSHSQHTANLSGLNELLGLQLDFQNTTLCDKAI